ncbi:hypothetical protein Lalb_Chr25g0288091 [Lupinus albus]|uniref:Uncharacterized protein n=1 Tax=Lupinus albus TaxID=3870 RepID=A0A6A4NFB2_LUPAL|nr:hypothetical protein Lalb_Chr25g0288091 [Lupinus albus]
MYTCKYSVWDFGVSEMLGGFLLLMEDLACRSNPLVLFCNYTVFKGDHVRDHLSKDLMSHCVQI